MKNKKDNKAFLKDFITEETETTFIIKDSDGEELVNIYFDPTNDTWKTKALLPDKVLEKEIKAPLTEKKRIIAETLNAIRTICDDEIKNFSRLKVDLILISLMIIYIILMIFDVEFNLPGDFTMGVLSALLSFAYFMLGMERKDYTKVFISVLWLLVAMNRWF